MYARRLAAALVCFQKADGAQSAFKGTHESMGHCRFTALVLCYC